MEFFRQVWAELKKVVWPTRAETIKYSIIVIVFSLAIAFILGAADYVLLSLFQTVLSR